jgi:hypothetical protein
MQPQVFEMSEMHRRMIQNGQLVESMDVKKRANNGIFEIQGKETANGKTRKIYITNRRRDSFRKTPRRVHFISMSEPSQQIIPVVRIATPFYNSVKRHSRHHKKSYRKNTHRKRHNKK